MGDPGDPGYFKNNTYACARANTCFLETYFMENNLDHLDQLTEMVEFTSAKVIQVSRFHLDQTWITWISRPVVAESGRRGVDLGLGEARR